MNCKAEVTFMVYGKNGVGRPEKRIFEMSLNDIIACSSSNRENNAQLMNWAKSQFPNAERVTIKGARRL